MKCSADSLILRAFASRGKKKKFAVCGSSKKAHSRIALARARAMDAIQSLQSLDDTIEYLMGMRESLRDTLRHAMPTGQKSSAKIAPGYTISVSAPTERLFCLCHGVNAYGCPASAGIDSVDPMGVPFAIRVATQIPYVRVERPEHETRVPALPFGAMASAQRERIIAGTWEDGSPIFSEAA